MLCRSDRCGSTYVLCQGGETFAVLQKASGTEEAVGRCIERQCVCHYKGDTKRSALEFPSQCPLVLLAMVGGRQATALGSEESEVTRS